MNLTDPSGRDDINTIPASVHYNGPTAECLLGGNTYNIEAVPGESPQQACSRAFPDSAELNTCELAGCYGSNGENTNGAVSPEDVNGGYNVEDPLIVDPPPPLPLQAGVFCLGILTGFGLADILQVPAWAIHAWHTFEVVDGAVEGGLDVVEHR